MAYAVLLEEPYSTCYSFCGLLTQVPIVSDPLPVGKVRREIGGQQKAASSGVCPVRNSCAFLARKVPQQFASPEIRKENAVRSRASLAPPLFCELGPRWIKSSRRAFRSLAQRGILLGNTPLWAKCNWPGPEGGQPLTVPSTDRWPLFRFPSTGLDSFHRLVPGKLVREAAGRDERRQVNCQ